MSQQSFQYCVDSFNRKRFKTQEVIIGNLKMGAENPIRVQSMTTIDTMDTQGSIDQSIRMIEAGCELVRITAPSKKEAENLKNIKDGLVEKGFNTPLVADIHFTPNAAEIAARLIEKVRVNPGNYADKKKFEEINFTDETYAKELLRIEEKFTPLIQICKENNTAMRIGTNHGSLSDRILSRYGDTPEGMVESAMEFLRICRKNDFNNLVISMKASNTLIMVYAYRLLVAEMIKENMNYPLHLGVTEAGDGEDGRIKSAVGIGALLEDGLGDTIRVSLTEDPEFEMPVAKKLISKYDLHDNEFYFDIPININYNPFKYNKRNTLSVDKVGGKHVPVVIGNLSKNESINPANLFSLGYQYSVQLDKWNIIDQAIDYLYIGKNKLDFAIPGTLRVIVDGDYWLQNPEIQAEYFPLVTAKELVDFYKDQLVFVEVDPIEDDLEVFKNYPLAILILKTAFSNKTQIYRYARVFLDSVKIQNPIILHFNNTQNDLETYQLHIASEAGNHFIDGFGDGLWIDGEQSSQIKNQLAFGILQATRTRISKTEYISCPSCGRTLFDLQETTQKIREKTSHLKGIKIGIMGCIVNGPGEMADADYGYVGSGVGKIHLYKEKEIMLKNVPEENAVEALINLIKENGDWIEPKTDHN